VDVNRLWLELMARARSQGPGLGFIELACNSLKDFLSEGGVHISIVEYVPHLTMKCK